MLPTTFRTITIIRHYQPVAVVIDSGFMVVGDHNFPGGYHNLSASLKGPPFPSNDESRGGTAVADTAAQDSGSDE